MAAKFRILHFEPDADYSADFREAAERLGIEVVSEPHGEEVPRIFREGRFDAVVLEYEADMHNGQEVLQMLLAINPDLHYVFLCCYLLSVKVLAALHRNKVPEDRRVVKMEASEDLLEVLTAFERQGLKPR